MHQEMKVTPSEILMFKINGYLNARYTASFIDQVTKEIEKTDSPSVILEFQEDAFVNSMGLGGIVKIWECCNKFNKTLQIYASEKITHLLYVARLDQVLEVRTIDKAPLHVD